MGVVSSLAPIQLPNLLLKVNNSSPNFEKQVRSVPGKGAPEKSHLSPTPLGWSVWKRPGETWQ